MHIEVKIIKDLWVLDLDWSWSAFERFVGFGLINGISVHLCFLSCVLSIRNNKRERGERSGGTYEFSISTLIKLILAEIILVFILSMKNVCRYVI